MGLNPQPLGHLSFQLSYTKAPAAQEIDCGIPNRSSYLQLGGVHGAHQNVSKPTSNRHFLHDINYMKRSYLSYQFLI